jgi:hypothetical protein
MAACSTVACSGADDTAAAVYGQAFGLGFGLGTNDPCDDPSSGITCHQDPQGPKIQNPQNPDLEGVAFFNSVGTYTWKDQHPAPTSVSATASGLIVNEGPNVVTDDHLAGLQLHTTIANKAQTFEIVGTLPRDARSRGRYLVDVDGQHLCSDMASGQGYAYVLPGHFDRRGYRQPSWQSVSFMCHDGAGAKAMRWGYDLLHPDHMSAGKRLAMADYCGNGESHTKLGTYVNHFDLAGFGQSWITDGEPADTNPSRFYFEAGWRADRPAKAAELAAHERWVGGAICLAKLRWQALPPGGYCEEQLPDPRTRPVGGGQFCEDMGSFRGVVGFLNMLAQHEAILFSSSQVNDVGLWRWHKKAVDSYVVTTHGFWAGMNKYMQTLSPPDQTDYTIDPDEYDAYVANILAADGGPTTKPLNLYTRTYIPPGLPPRIEYRTTAQTGLTPDWELVETLGYIYEGQQASYNVPKEFWGVQLHEFTRTDANGHIEYVLSSYSSSPPGFDNGIIEGYGFTKVF